MGCGPGRTSEYFHKVKPRLKEVKEWAADGLNDKQIAENLGISQSSFYNYVKRHLEFVQSLKSGETRAITQVENSLFKSANGFETEEVTYEMLPKRDSEGKIVRDEFGDPLMVMTETKRVKKETAPNNTSMIFYLTNRAKGEWKHRQEMIHSGGQTINHLLNGKPPEEMSEEEVMKELTGFSEMIRGVDDGEEGTE